MNIDTELQDYEAAGSLAEELPYWGWLEDERTCLTRAGELMSLARVSPCVLDGQTPEQLDRVIDRWQRMLSGLDARTRFYFYLLRRPIHFPEVADGGGVSNVVTLGQRKRRAFLTERVQDVSAYVAWAYDPGLSTVASERAGPWWMAVAKNWMARRKNAQRSVYLHSSIEAAAAGFRQTVDASRALVDDLTPLRLLQAHEASSDFERTDQPARNAVGRRDRQRHELAAGRLRTRSGAAQPSPGRGARCAVLAALSPRLGPQQSLGRSLPPRCDPDGHARMASSAARFCPAKDPGRTAPLLLKAVLDERPRSGDGGKRGGGKYDPCLYRRASPLAWPRSSGHLWELPRAVTYARRRWPSLRPGGGRPITTIYLLAT